MTWSAFAPTHVLDTVSAMDTGSDLLSANEESSGRPEHDTARWPRRTSLRLAAAALAVALAWPIMAATPPTTLTRKDVTQRIEEARRILTPNGIERHETPLIGGITQWVSIRGADRRNPVLLYLHGGPGDVEMPMSWWNERGWSEYFTVVQWDQRGAGKTYLLNDPAQIGPTLTLERMVADTEEMADWVRRELGKKKIFVLGHSFGSYLGFELAQRHPDWLHAYIGVGQLSSGPENERRGWKFAHDAALRAGNTEAVRELDGIAPYFTSTRPPTLHDLFTQRKWLKFYGGAVAYRHDETAASIVADLSPDYTDDESAHVWDGNGFSEERLLMPTLKIDLTDVHALGCPFVLFAGRHDTNVNSELAAEWFKTIAAPEKHLVWFEHSAHMPMFEEPGKFLVSLVRYARPIAERAGDAAP